MAHLYTGIRGFIRVSTVLYIVISTCTLYSYYTWRSIHCIVPCNQFILINLEINWLKCTMQFIHCTIRLYPAINSSYRTLRLIHCTVSCNISILFYLTIGEDRPRFEASPTGNKESTLVLLIFKLSKNIRCIKINFKLF